MIVLALVVILTQIVLLLAFAWNIDGHTASIANALHVHLAETKRIRQLYEESARKSAEAAATVAKIRRRVMGDERDN